MLAETRRRNLGARGDPEFGSWPAYASILIVDDEGTSSPRIRHRADPCAGRYDCEHRALCRPAPRVTHGFANRCTPIAAQQITAFRHSVDGFARRAPCASAAVGALGNAA